jgi:hypothetical protein
MLELSIIIVNYETEKHVFTCIDSILNSIEINSYEIIVVDNTFPNYYFEESISRLQNVKYFNLVSNKGFGYACNRGAEHANGKVLLFLNPDIIVKNKSIENLIEVLTNKSDVGFVTGLLTDESGLISYFYNYFPDISWEFKEAFGLFRENTIKALNNVAGIKNKTPFQIDWAHGACLMIKSEVFKLTSGFDENIFLYYEDVDIQKHIKNLNYKNYCQPNSQFIHFARSSVRSNSGLKVYYFYMNHSKLYYMKKYYPFWKRLSVRIFYILGYSTKIMMLPFRTKYKNDRKLLLSLYMIVIGVHLNLKKKI